MTKAAVMSSPPASRPPHAIDLSQERPAAPASVPVPMAPVSYAPRAWLQASPRETALPPATASHIVRASMSTPATEARITVVFLLYRAASEVPGLVETLVRQKHPRLPEQSEWLEALFMDDASGDDTPRVLEETLRKVGTPAHYRFVPNPRNLGLAATLNKALGLVRTPYVLTCHLDCRFGREDYVAAMLDLLERHPRAAAITGQPVLRDPREMPFAEKLNVVANLMDLFPADTREELVPVGFAEGRCDAFRLEALAAVGDRK